MFMKENPNRKKKQKKKQQQIANQGFFGTVAVTTQTGFYLFKVNNRSTKNTGVRCKMYLKLIVTVFIINFQQISHIHLVFPSMTLSKQILAQ